MNSTTREKRKAQQPPTDEEESGNNSKPNTAPYLPTPIINEILLRAEIRTLFNCRRVCKSWAKLISSHEFAQLHLSRSRTKCLISSPNAKICERKPIRLHLVDLEDLNTYSPQNNIPVKTRVELPDVLTYRVTSCNGLLCFIASDPNLPSNCLHMRERFLIDSQAIYVCNPVHREYITIPKPSDAKKLCEEYFAFGYSIRTNQYKVIVCSLDIRSSSMQTDIYTLGERSWRRIVNAPYLVRSGDYGFNTSVNGSFHWIQPQQGSSDPLICSFDFGTEEFHSVPEPSEFGPLDNQHRYKMRVGAINGNLYLSDCSKAGLIAIWVMKDYGVRESWSKYIVINKMICAMRQLGVYELIMTMSDGKILVKSEYESIINYNPKSQVIELELGFPGISLLYSIVAHVPSLISLKDVAKHENVMVLRGCY